MKTTEYINSKIIKYQNPSSGIQKRDAIKDYRPQLPSERLEKTYTPVPQPVLSQDNRSTWELSKPVRKLIKVMLITWKPRKLHRVWID